MSLFKRKMEMAVLEGLCEKGKTLLIMAAHQDDAEFSCGRLMLRRRGMNTYVTYFTDGRKGQVDGKAMDEVEYATLRKSESIRAMAGFGVPEDRLMFLGLPDQALIRYPYVIDKVLMQVRKIRPDLVLIPPWEGAHPDHDAVHLFTVIGLRNAGFPMEDVFEYASYNNFSGEHHVQRFIPHEGSGEERLKPTYDEQRSWSKIMRIFSSQKSLQDIYVPRSMDEGYRTIPAYDYSRLPYSSKTSSMIRGLLKPMYPITRKVLPKKDKMYYETWENEVDPTDIVDRSRRYGRDYSIGSGTGKDADKGKA